MRLLNYVSEEKKEETCRKVNRVNIRVNKEMGE